MNNTKFRISTKLLLDADFSSEPTAFSSRNGVRLVEDVYSQVDFRRDADDLESDVQIKKSQFNVHLVRHGAIRLFVERDGDHCDWVRSIELNPSRILYADDNHTHHTGDLVVALSVLMNEIAPLLSDPCESRHIIPGLVLDEESVAHWTMIHGEVLLPDIETQCLHGLSHPNTGPAEGVLENRIQLGDKKDECMIRFEKEQGQGTRVLLTLKKQQLTREFEAFGKIAEIDNTMRLLAFTESDIAHVYHTVLARMQGTYLPVPAEWRDPTKGKPATPAKVMALLSCLTLIKPDEIQSMGEGVRSSSDSTRRRLKRDVDMEINKLDPQPVASLFHSPLPAFPASGVSLADGRIIPAIEEVYGERCL